MKTAIIGSRNIVDSFKIKEILNTYTITVVVSGGAKGVDSIAENYAIERTIPTVIFKPDWKQFGRSAGIIRNKDIVNEADRVIAFWDGKSKGTADSIKYALKEQKIVDVWFVENDVYTLINIGCDIQKLLKV